MKLLVCAALWQDNLQRMIRSTILVFMLCITGGCQFYRNIIVNEGGQVFPWYTNRDNPECQKKWTAERAEWEINDAGTRYRAGQIDRATYNRIRKHHGLPVED